MQKLLQVQDETTTLGVAYLRLQYMSPGSDYVYFTETLVLVVAPLGLAGFAVPLVLLLHVRSRSQCLSVLVETKLLFVSSIVVVLFFFQPILRERTAELFIIVACVWARLQTINFWLVTFLFNVGFFYSSTAAALLCPPLFCLLRVRRPDVDILCT